MDQPCTVQGSDYAVAVAGHPCTVQGADYTVAVAGQPCTVQGADYAVAVAGQLSTVQGADYAVAVAGQLSNSLFCNQSSHRATALVAIVRLIQGIQQQQDRGPRCERRAGVLIQLGQPGALLVQLQEGVQQVAAAQAVAGVRRWLQHR